MKKNTKTILLILATIVVVFIVIYGILKNKFLHSTLQDKVTENTKGRYRFIYDNIKVDEVNGHILITHLHIIPDTTLFSGKNDSLDIPSTMVSIDISKLEISGVKTPKALLKKEITGKSIHLDSVQITLYQGNKETKDSVKKDMLTSICQDVLGSIK